MSHFETTILTVHPINHANVLLRFLLWWYHYQYLVKGIINSYWYSSELLHWHWYNVMTNDEVRAWMSNYIPQDILDMITYRCPNYPLLTAFRVHPNAASERVLGSWDVRWSTIQSHTLLMRCAVSSFNWQFLSIYNNFPSRNCILKWCPQHIGQFAQPAQCKICGLYLMIDRFTLVCQIFNSITWLTL